MGKRGNNEGSITQLSDGRWQARITLEGNKRKAFYGRTRQEAARLLAAALRDRDKGIPIVAEKQTIKQYLVGESTPGDPGYPQGWLGSIKGAVRPKTFVGYEGYMRLHIIPTLGKIVLARLTPQQVQDLYTRKLGEGLSPTSVNHLHAALHRALEQAVRLGVVVRNVADMVSPPKVQRQEMATLSLEQTRAFLAAAAGDRLEALYILAVSTGMRQGELLGLRWADVDLDAATLQVRATLHRTTVAGVQLAEPKTAGSRRQVALTRLAVGALRHHKGRQAEERLKAGPAWEDRELVFPNLHGRPIEATNLLKRSFKPLLERAGLPDIRFHDLRHTAATVLLRKKVPVKVVSEMLGHSQVGITLNIYSHVLPDMQRDATAAMEAALQG